MALIVGLIVLACVVVLIGVALRISAALLRVSVRMTNGILGGRDIDEQDFRRASVYSYEPIPRPKSLAGIRIPVPGVMYAILVNIGSGFASLVAQVGAVLGVAALTGISAELPNDPTAPVWERLHVLSWVVGAPAGLFATVVVLKMALPTTYLRAAMVTFCQFVISLVIVFALGLGLVIGFGAAVGDLPTQPQRGGNAWFK